MWLRKEVPVLVHVGQMEVKGLIHLPRSKNLLSFFNSSQQFFALHKAEIYPGTTSAIKTDYLVINKERVSSIRPL